jgi:branched-chain amino acid transport system permease protein
VQLNWRRIGFYGFLTGIAIWYVSLVGMVETFDKRDVITEILSLGWALIVVIALGLGYIAGLKLTQGNPVQGVLSGLLTGLLGGVIAAGLPVLMTAWESMRSMFINASSPLFELLTFSQEPMAVGLLYLIGIITALGTIGAVTSILPRLPRRLIVAGFSAVLLFGMLSELLDVILSRSKAITPLAKFLFGKTGLSVSGAVAVFIIFGVLSVLWVTQHKKVSNTIDRMPERPRRIFNRAMIVVSALLLIILPQAVGPYISQILVLVGLYALMGLGLNIEIGLAGLLDLGFVGFFAIGAYTVGLMTSTADMGFGTVVNTAPGTSFTTSG